MRIALVGAELEENLSVRYIRGALEADGHDVVQLAFDRRDDIDRVAVAVAHSNAAVTGLSMVFTARAREFADLARAVRGSGYRGLLVAGGHFAAFNAEALLGEIPQLDAAAIGEGEGIMRALARGGNPRDVQGLVWRDSRGVLVRNELAIPPELDDLPWPVHKEPFARYHGIAIADLLSSRGCSHACAFCSIAAWHRMCGAPRLRMRSVGDVVDEMAWLHDRGVRIFNFHDDNFLPRRTADATARVEDLAGAVRARGLGGIAFAIKARPDSVDPDVFRRLVDLGLFRVFLGIEAGTAGALERLGRGQTVAQNERALQVLNDLGVHVCYNLLLLDPDTTLDELAGNVAFLREHTRNPMNFCRTEVYAGTPLEDRLQRQGRLRGTWWGRDYRIADERAQRAFEAMRALFHERVYGMPGAHHMAMQVDYQLQLAEHFFGPRAHLRRRVKAYLRRVNLDTCDRLEAVVRAAGEGVAPGEIVARERAGVDRADQALMEAGRALLDELQHVAGEERDRSPWRRTAAAGLVATVAMTGGCCEAVEERLGKDYHYSEMVAEPLPADIEAMRQAAQQVLPLVAPRVQPGHGLSMDLYVNAQGQLEYCHVREDGTITFDCPAREGLVFPDRAIGNSDVPSFSAQEVDAARAQEDVFWPVGDATTSLERGAGAAPDAPGGASMTLYVDATSTVYWAQIEGVDEDAGATLRIALQGLALAGVRDVRLEYERNGGAWLAKAATVAPDTVEITPDPTWHHAEMVAMDPPPQLAEPEPDWHHVEMVAQHPMRTDTRMSSNMEISGLDPASGEHSAVRRVVQRKRLDVRRCYEEAFEASGDHERTVEVGLTILPDGTVGAVRVGPADVDLGAFVTCCEQRLGGWVFPARESGDVEVTLTCEMSVETETLK